MINTLNFQTSARTLDHLGREQIADVPTAISELWKNAYDAYASKANLTLYDGVKPVIAICDDGHGMSYTEFVERWLVVGTKSKLFDDDTKTEDRLGLPTRPKQGQKGIGRLSSAHLGPLMLLISKRKNEDAVVALLDWRIFENPYLLLSDIKVPVTTVKVPENLFDVLPALFDGLMENIWGENQSDTKNNNERSKRILHAWKLYDDANKHEYEKEKLKDIFDAREWLAPSSKIAETIVESYFSPLHLEAWSVWNKETTHGTAMLISEINDDFNAYLASENITGTEKYIKDRFFDTLSAFIDPFHDSGESEIESRDINGAVPEFSVKFDLVSDGNRKTIVGHLPFDRMLLNEMEHVLFGTIDEAGNFSGCVKVFGKWRKNDYGYKIPKPVDLKLPKKSHTRLGEFDLYISTIEIELENTTHEPQQHKIFVELAHRYSRLSIYRDGLRVLPYGREESDFFEIETRRSKNAGLYFWNKRRMFGRIALRRYENPNLRDKAGREGFIDNTASKFLKKIVENILIEVAGEYFGRKSDIRATELPEIKSLHREQKEKERALADQKKLKKKRKREFVSNVKNANSKLPELISKIDKNISDLMIKNTEDAENAQVGLEKIREQLDELIVRGAQPSNITSKAELEVRDYKSSIAEATGLVTKLSEKIKNDVERVDPKEPWKLLENQIKRASDSISRRLTKWDNQISNILSEENSRVSLLKDARKIIFKSQTDPILNLVQDSRESLAIAAKKVEQIRADIDDDNAVIFEGYISALESLTESIDLQNIAINGVYESEELKAEIDRLNELAQLGITVEILGHELMSYDNMIGSGLSALPQAIQKTNAVKSISTGYQGLSQQLNFLAPLKISGQRSSEKISGQDILDYLKSFFEKILIRRNISLSASDEFLKFSIYEQPARLYPVFINLVNNSQYWLSTVEKDSKQILLDIIYGKVVVSDNGPGIEDIDIKKLFHLFFTRKSSGGRGVGLYICRANLRAGGHDISYVVDPEKMVLPGANFLIQFSNVEFK